MRNARAFEQIRDSAMKDPLTGLPNARHLRTHLENEIRRAQRQNQPISLLAIDMDDFKAVNDTMGHQAGDTVLQQAAGIFLAQLRDYDHVARTGGDEFVIILPGTPANEAASIADRIRRGIEAYARKAMGTSSTRLAASVGLASYPDDAGDVETLLAKADAAMYEDKRAHKQTHVAA
jgi:diguanylate cyclase (GGDEF)-like protein